MIPVVYITDNNFVMQTSVSITSLIYNRKKSNYKIYIIGSNLTQENINLLNKLSTKNSVIEIIEGDISKIKNLHIFNEDSEKYLSATESALFKFQIPHIFKNHSKILYIDGDTIITNSLEELYNTELENNYVAAAHDTGKIYFKQKYTELCPEYFNSGVMLLNLDLLRKESVSEKLIKTKLELKDSALMDQNVLNIVFKDRIKIIDIKYNLLIQNLERASGQWNIETINHLFNSKYKNFKDIKKHAYIIHFSSKDKPWFYNNLTFSDLWYKYYRKSPFGKRTLKRIKYTKWNAKSLNIEKIDIDSIIKKEKINYEKNTINPTVSIILAVYNAEKYLDNCLISLIQQTYKNIEILCIDDCSTDNSYKILEEYSKKDSRIKIYRLPKNSKQGTARNKGLELAQGKYISFVDSDDFLALDFIEKTFNVAEKTNCDIVVSNIKNFILERSENNIKQLQNLDSSYKTLELEDGLHRYNFRLSPSIRSGPVAKLYKKEIIDKYKISFPQNLIQEDEAFHWFYMTRIRSLYFIEEELYYRLIHSNSVMYNLNFNHKNCLDHLKIIKIIYKHLKDSGKLSRYKNKFRKHICSVIKNLKCPLLKIYYIISISFYMNIIFYLLNKSLLEELYFLNKIKQYKHKKLAFWGASIFLNNLIHKYKIENENIVGIIDKDPNKTGVQYGKYKIYPPEKLNDLGVDVILFSIKNRNYEIYRLVKKYIKNNHPNIKLLANPFQRF